jgi:GTP pyrophosphokinase/guanosine-3',5'-bis(diphosphate) 3'-pyrophosphohydrolase
MEQEESQDLGAKMLAQALRAEGMTMPQDDGPGALSPVWPALLRWSGNRSREELLTDIGVGRKIASIVAKRLARLLTERGVRPDAVTLTMGRYGADEATPSQGMVLIDGSEGASIQLATCCRPIPGDSILGYVGRGEGLQIHTTDCTVGKRLFGRDSEDGLNVDWAEQPIRSFETGVSLLLKNGKGVLAEVATAVAAAEADITHIDMGDQAASETAELKLLLAVRDRLHLAEVMRTLKRSAAVLRISRIKP